MRLASSRSGTLVVVAALAATQLGATDCGRIIKDPGFDLWCGDTLCAWKLERGTIARAPTWHTEDAGVAFAGPDDAIAQLAPVTSQDTRCIEFDLIADVATDATVVLNIDIEGDGSVERSETIPTAHWQPLTYTIAIDGPYDSVRFELAKQGGGRAVLAQIEAHTASNCAGIPTIHSAMPAPNGGRCGGGPDCASGVCDGGGIFAWGTCVGCTSDATCSGGDVCGLGDPVSPDVAIPIECVAPDKELGDRCTVARECASGICARSRCSACDPDAAQPGCTGGLACGPAYTFPVDAGFLPNAYVCGASSHAVATGAACGGDADCASGHCDGAVRMECATDGRACTTAASCPVDSGLTPGHCLTVGVQGGTCQ